MPVSVEVPQNKVQKIPTQRINERVVVHPNTWYTCPTGKKAVAKGLAVCTGTGAAANTDLQASGVTIRRVLAAGGSADTWQRVLDPNVTFDFDVRLDAGEILQTIQDAGTNAEWELFIEITETPA